MTANAGRQEGTPGDGSSVAGRPAPRGSAGRQSPFTRSAFDNRILPLLLIAPAMLVVFGLVGFPVLRTFYLSFFDARAQQLLADQIEFVGLDNYVHVLTDPHYRRVFVTTAVFGLSCVVGTMLLGIAVALLLNRPFKGRVILGVAVLLPWAMPDVAAATVWRWLFHDQYGLVNWFLVLIGFTNYEQFAWFNTRGAAFTAIGIVVVWQSFPFVALALLAGLQSISSEVLEAARIDGAGPWQVTTRVTLPLLKPLLLVLTVISTIWDFKVFSQVYVMTGGGPARATEVLMITTWIEAFTRLDFGLASALAMCMFVILVIITVIYIRMIREEQGMA